MKANIGERGFKMAMRSFLDQDLYTFTVGQAVAKKHPNASTVFEFKDRNNTQYNEEFLDNLLSEIDDMQGISLTYKEADFLNSIGFLDSNYVNSLLSYRFNPDQVQPRLDENGHLSIKIEGPWQETLFWEVPLLYTVSELYFKYCDTDWNNDNQLERLYEKADILKGCFYADFGTRRRRNYETQKMVVSALKGREGFRGTSNAYLAYLYKVAPIGTMSHQWIMGTSALKGLRHANKYALQDWSDVFQGNLGIALPDTFGTDAFFQDFDGYLARLFDGIRHDSGDPYAFGEKVILHYKKLNIDPRSKTIVFSDGLNPIVGQELTNHFAHRIKVSLGIGTNLTNDFPGSKALNIVIKLTSCNGIPVVKLSDVGTKAIGDHDALRVARWVFNRTPLDAYL